MPAGAGARLVGLVRAKPGDRASSSAASTGGAGGDADGDSAFADDLCRQALARMAISPADAHRAERGSVAALERLVVRRQPTGEIVRDARCNLRRSAPR